MKRFLKICGVITLLTIMLLSITVASAEEKPAGNIDVVSGKEICGELEVDYQLTFDAACEAYRDQLNDAEKFASNAVFDAIAMIDFSSDESLAARKRIWEIKSADDLHAILTGFFDPNDAEYTADDELKAHLTDVFTACGLDINDYYLSVIKNIPGMPEPIEKENWYCRLNRKENYSLENGYDIRIICYGEKMTVGFFSMNADLF